MLRRSTAVLVSLVVLLGVLVHASGAGSASPSTHRDTKPPDVKAAPPLKANATPAACTNISPSTKAYTFDHPFPGGSIDVCGTFKGDSLWVTDNAGGGTQVWAGSGNDIVRANNKKIDYIWGGPGKNSATIDWCLPNGQIHDTTVDVAHVKKVKTKCTGVKRSSRHTAATAITYPYEEPLIDCTATSAGRFRVVVARDPTMRAVDATPNVDWQTVAFSAVLYQLSPDSEWVLLHQSPWVWDRAPDNQLESFSGNLWQPFGKTGSPNIFFTPPSSGQYRVGIEYHWYAANGLGSHDDFEWANFHFDHFASGNLDECDFPSQPPPDGQYKGTTDEGRAISFSTEPIWTTASRLVGGTRITDVKLDNTADCGVHGIGNFEIDPPSTRWIQLNYDNTFAYAGTINFDAETAKNVRATYTIAGKIDTAGNATGTLAIWLISFDKDGSHYDCTGKPRSWTAKVAG
jgi:hypothetical protein